MALSDAILQLEKEEAMSDPWLRGGVATGQIARGTPTNSWQSALASVLGQAAGGAMKGYGASQLNERRGERDTALADILSGGGDVVAQMRQQPDIFPASLVKSQAMEQSEQQQKMQAMRDQLIMEQEVKQQFAPQVSPFKSKTDILLGLASNDPRLAGMDQDLLRQSVTPKGQQISVHTGDKAPAYKITKDYRDVLSSSPEYKEYSEINKLYKAAEGVAESKEPASDQLFISSMARFNDPGSTVRGEEFETTVDWAQTPLSKYEGLFRNILLGEGRLTPKVKKEILKAAQPKLKSFGEAYNVRARTEQANTTHFGGEGKRILPIPLYQSAGARQAGKAQAAQKSAPPPPQPGETRDAYFARVRGVK